jgi:hypothetical protein
VTNDDLCSLMYMHQNNTATAAVAVSP